MFRSTLVKLTLVYVILTMALSLSFSFVFYRLATHELSEGLHHQYEDIVGNDHDTDNKHRYDHESSSELQQRQDTIRNGLVYVDIGVLIGSVVVGYVLARRSLRPIEEAHRSQLRFTAEASHELKTPLTAMKADTESMLMQRGANASELRATLKNNLSDIERLERLTRHLLDMGRYRSDAKPRLEEVDLPKLLGGVVRQLGIKYKSKNVRIEQQCTLAVVYAEPLSLEQLLVILTDNAVKYSPKGGMVRIAASQVQRKTVITVQDNGSGIDPEDLPHIFEHFYRSKQHSSTKAASGYGLGLPLAKDIVDMYKGSISVDSKANEGTTVTVRLPLKTA